jgi:hypothetical protein
MEALQAPHPSWIGAHNRPVTVAALHQTTCASREQQPLGEGCHLTSGAMIGVWEQLSGR